jgi:hypothetical protein
VHTMVRKGDVVRRILLVVFHGLLSHDVGEGDPLAASHVLPVQAITVSQLW